MVYPTLSTQVKVVVFEPDNNRFRIITNSNAQPTLYLTVEAVAGILVSVGKENSHLVQNAVTQAYLNREDLLTAAANGKAPVETTQRFEPEGPYFRETIYRWVCSHEPNYKGPSRVRLEPWKGALYELVPESELPSAEEIEDLRAFHGTLIEIPKDYRQTLDPDTLKSRWLRPVSEPTP